MPIRVTARETANEVAACRKNAEVVRGRNGVLMALMVGPPDHPRLSTPTQPGRSISALSNQSHVSSRFRSRLATPSKFCDHDWTPARTAAPRDRRVPGAAGVTDTPDGSALGR